MRLSVALTGATAEDGKLTWVDGDGGTAGDDTRDVDVFTVNGLTEDKCYTFTYNLAPADDLTATACTCKFTKI